MNCPVCRTPLMVLEHALIEVDYCDACCGIWLDAGELELLLGDRAAAFSWLKDGKPISAGERARRCPICRGKMHKETTRGPEPVTYDLCNHDHGMWFDKGELQAILQYGCEAETVPTPVAAWLRDLFAHPPAEEK